MTGLTFVARRLGLDRRTVLLTRMVMYRARRVLIRRTPPHAVTRIAVCLLPVHIVSDRHPPRTRSHVPNRAGHVPDRARTRIAACWEAVLHSEAPRLYNVCAALSLGLCLVRDLLPSTVSILEWVWTGVLRSRHFGPANFFAELRRSAHNDQGNWTDDALWAGSRPQ